MQTEVHYVRPVLPNIRARGISGQTMVTFVTARQGVRADPISDRRRNMPILVMGLSALMVFAVMGIILVGAMHAEHREREKERHHPLKVV